jgi:hypothetical protein
VGEISNPVAFTSTQLLTVLGIKDAGNNYQDIHEWLQRMPLTGIHFNGIVYMARGTPGSGIDRVVTAGGSGPLQRRQSRNWRAGNWKDSRGGTAGMAIRLSGRESSGQRRRNRPRCTRRRGSLELLHGSCGNPQLFRQPYRPVNLR